MAFMHVEGADAFLDDLATLASLPNSVIAGILNAEADVIVQAQRDEIQRQWSGPYSEDISAKCIKKTAIKLGLNGHSVSIYPQGTRVRGKKDPKRIRNGEIAFINEYGVPERGIAARPAIGTATAKKEREAVEAGEKVYHAYLDSKGL